MLMLTIFWSRWRVCVCRPTLARLVSRSGWSLSSSTGYAMVLTLQCDGLTLADADSMPWRPQNTANVCSFIRHL